MCRLLPELSVRKEEVMPYAPRQRPLDVGASPSFCAGHKLGEVVQALLWTLLQEEPACPSRALLDKAATRQIAMRVSLRHLNRWRAKWQLNRRKGRPRQSPCQGSAAFGAPVVHGPSRLAFV